MKRILVLFILSLTLLSAQEVTRDKVNQIYQIQDDSTRLASFDQWAKSLGLARTSIESLGNWFVEVDSDPIDDSKKIVFSCRASEGGSAYDTPTIIIRWQNGELDSYIYWDDYLADNSQVTLRFDSEDAYKERWSMSTNSQATFCTNPQAFIDKLLVHDRLVTRITPYNEGPTTLVFDISGLREESDVFPELGW